jgi:hypothetical protein
MDRNALNVRAPVAAAPPPPPPSEVAPPPAATPAPAQAAPPMSFEQAMAELLAAQADLDGDGVPDAQQAAPATPEASAPASEAPRGRNALFPSGGTLPNYGFGDVSQMSKMGLTPTAEGEISGPAERPREYTAPIAEMTPPIIPGGAAIARVLPRAVGAVAAGIGASAMTSETSESDESPISNLAKQRGTLAARLEATRAKMDAAENGQRGAAGRGKDWRALNAEAETLKSELSGVDAQIEAYKNSDEYQQDVQQRAKDLETAEKKRIASTPWRELHPDAAGVLPYAGIAAAALVPGTAGARKNIHSLFPGSTPGRMRNALNVGREAFERGTLDQKDLAARELRERIAAKPSVAAEKSMNTVERVGSAASGGLLATEGVMLPDQIDSQTLPEGEAKERASERASDLWKYAKTIGIGTATGFSGYKVGKTYSPTKTADYEGANALAGGLEAQMARNAAAGAKRSAARKGGKLKAETPPQAAIEAPPAQAQLPAPTAAKPVKGGSHPDHEWDAKAGRWRGVDGKFIPGGEPK